MAAMIRTRALSRNPTFSHGSLRRLRNAAISKGLIVSKWSYFASPLWLDEMAELEKDLANLESLLFSLPEKAYEGNVEAFMNDLEVPLEIQRWILDYSFELLWRSTPLRWDLMFDGHGFKVLELNTGVALGGFNFEQIESETLAFLSDCGEKEVTAFGWESAFQALHHQFSKNCEAYRQGKNIVILDEDAFFETYHPLLESLARGLTSVAPQKIFKLAKLSEVEVRGGRFSVNQMPIDCVIPMMPVLEWSNLSQQFSWFGELVRTVPFVLHPGEAVFSCKSILALLFKEGVRKKLSAKEIALIDKLVPKTYLVDPDTLLPSSPAQWVLKPSQTFGGEGIVCGWDVPEAVFSQAFCQVKQAKRTYVLQQKVEASPVHLEGLSCEEVFIEGEGVPVVGLVRIDEKTVGGFYRAFMGEPKKSVINLSQGAACGPLIRA